ncbi:MAG: DUF2851 family protein, partial [Bacteroidota bacterium]
MDELLLHYIWQHRRYDGERLFTEDGHRLEILHSGTYNRDAGPDFLNARIRLHGMQWVGNVEIHINSSDWNRHRHTDDPAYINCILHVVWHHDAEVSGSDGRLIPTLELKHLIPDLLVERYRHMMQRSATIACRDSFHEVPKKVLYAWAERMMVGWLESRTSMMRSFLEYSRGHWEEAFYHALARAFGFHVNGDPFERLSRAVPLGILLRNRDKPFTISSLYFGMAGFLDGRFYAEEDNSLRSEFLYLSKKWHLERPDFPGWKFMRMRPSNFPTKRLSQFLDLNHRYAPLLSSCLAADDLTGLLGIFQTKSLSVPAPFGAKVAVSDVMGVVSIRVIIVNTVIPFLFLKGAVEGDQVLCEKVLEWMQELSPEDNVIIRAWKDLGWIHPRSFHARMITLS